MFAAGWVAVDAFTDVFDSLLTMLAFHLSPVVLVAPKTGIRAIGIRLQMAKRALSIAVAFTVQQRKRVKLLRESAAFPSGSRVARCAIGAKLTAMNRRLSMAGNA